ncbi:Cmr2p SKDI_15G2430 [Saccharomyces kudriavzevii IFO 1802]|uniref:DMAP1-binding domain-containing protein n=1 Tax=Saccharomyces kudriavzevii (strain ATCC MYA-4449 / AS 2.2408 / CBS 8840 / NBRC 1802 / NCYC 2889) TaxID=226230 RepID=A0AA35J9X4_SACK1|nr:uncharacterized protein SKDI_15G2430 [Saccharomyces kudriavzevii IFO 1802]CAI4051492.1 hypothetical protein SKDI_15G2430 [Saccharomyces kudriavzevii IFO 1802]
MDFSIPPTLPLDLQSRLNEIIQDYKDENLTRKGYETKRKQLLDGFEISQMRPYTPIRSPNSRKSKHPHKRNTSLASSISSIPNSIDRRHSIYRVTTINSTSVNNTPRRRGKRYAASLQSSLPGSTEENASAKDAIYNPMIPLLPRHLEPGNSGDGDPSTTDSLPLILRGRFEHYDGQTAMISINSKGKETFITWDKLYLKAERVAHELNKSPLYKMDKILLWYNKNDVIEFTIALLGCFISGMAAIPVSFETYSLREILEIIKVTNSKYVLISNACHKQLDNLYSSSSNSKVKLIKNDVFQQIKFVRTDDLGTYTKAKKTSPTFDIPNISYIEFTRTPLGRLSGVVMKHNILINQFETMTKILNSRSMPHWKQKSQSIRKPFHKKIMATNSRFVILNSLDPTRSTGLIMGVLFNLFTGNLLISIDSSILQRSGGYENIIDKFRADILLNDQLQLKQVVINYLENPESAFSKKHKIDFSCIKSCLTSCTTIDTDVTEMVVHKWLKNLGCIDAPFCYSPMLTLLDFGGIFISIRDQLGNLENFPIHNSKLRLQNELFINREKLKLNEIECSITAMINSSSSFKDYLKLETFGFPIPDVTLCVVNPDTNTLVQDLTVGEVWISSNHITDEFYQMDKVNEFVFKAKLNYSEMFAWARYEMPSGESEAVTEQLDTILNICPASTYFMRTKLMGFVHNGKIYVLSLIEDMFLQNRLVRLSNWAHTSNLLHKKGGQPPQSTGNGNAESIKTTDISTSNGGASPEYKRVVESHYLQQITETVVRTVNTVFEVAAFELQHHKEEHFLVMVIESSLAKTEEEDKNNVTADSTLISFTEKQKVKLETKMNDLTDQIFRILWIFHKIQPMCILVVPKDTLPRRYCSLELANSTVEKKFLNNDLSAHFVKFQFDNVILDFLPHSAYYNESILSEHLSKLRKKALQEEYTISEVDCRKGAPVKSKLALQCSGVDYREESVDTRSHTKLTDFKSILEILEWRVSTYGNETAFSDGTNTNVANSSANNDNNVHKKVSWASFGKITANFLKKIVGSKIPLKYGDAVIVMCENSVEYVAMILACLFCNFLVIPLPSIKELTVEEDLKFLVNIIQSYKVKRLFVDGKLHSLLDNNNIVSKCYKRYKSLIPKITVFSKVKAKNALTISMFKNVLKQKFGAKPGTRLNMTPCVIWINTEYDVTSNIHVTMTHSSLLNASKIVKETLQLRNNSPLFSICSHTCGLGFMFSCLLGIYTGASTCLFSLTDVLTDPKEFLIGLQNLNVKDLYLRLENFYSLLDRASNLIEGSKHKKENISSGKNNTSSSVREDIFKGVRNIMIPFLNRPRVYTIENILKRYPTISLTPTQINYVYQHHFNPVISLRSYLDIPPIDLYLDPVSLREGIIREVNPNDMTMNGKAYIKVQESGVVPVCTDVSVVNPETLLPCVDGEFGEIWCCSEANAFDYFICNGSKNRLYKDPFITEQFKSKMKSEMNNTLSYLRTGDLGFIKNVSCTNSQGDVVNLNLLFVLGSIHESIDILGLTHFVSDLERTVKEVHADIGSCLIAKAGGLLVCLIRCKERRNPILGNLTTLIVSELLGKHGVILDLCAFVKTKGISSKNSSMIMDVWAKNRASIMQAWFDQRIQIEAQFGINYGENISIYLLSDYEKDNI